MQTSFMIVPSGGYVSQNVHQRLECSRCRQHSQNKGALIDEVAATIHWGMQYLIEGVCSVLGLIPYSDLMPNCWILGQAR